MTFAFELVQARMQGVVRCLEEGYGEIQVEEPCAAVRWAASTACWTSFARHPPAIAKSAQGFVPNIGAA